MCLNFFLFIFWDNHLKCTNLKVICKNTLFLFLFFFSKKKIILLIYIDENTNLLNTYKFDNIIVTKILIIYCLYLYLNCSYTNKKAQQDGEKQNIRHKTNVIIR